MMRRKEHSLGQSAIELLTTYGWAVLIILVSLAIMVNLGMFTNPLPSQCTFPGDLNCRIYVLNTSGTLALELGQATDHPIKILALRCTQESNAVLNASDALKQPILIPLGASVIVTNGTQSCTRMENGVAIPVSGSRGSMYKGKIYVAYEEVDTGSRHVVVGDVQLKYEDVTLPTPFATPKPVALITCQSCAPPAGTCAACPPAAATTVACGGQSTCGTGCTGANVCNGGTGAGSCGAKVAKGGDCVCNGQCSSNACVNGHCVDCSSDAQCPAGTPRCVNNQCVPCTAGTQATDCNDGKACTDDSCTAANTCTNTVRGCNDLNPCTSDSCNASTGACVNQQMGCGSGCGGSSVCNSAGACVGKVGAGISCSCDEMCTSGICSAVLPRTCVSCTSGAQCSDGSVCTLDQCVSGACTNPADPAKCGVACAGGVCNGGGSCIAPGSVATGGSCICNQVCASGTCTGGVCVPSTVVCGTCQKCNSGTCGACAPGQCVNTAAGSTSTCGSACASPTMCDGSGHCVGCTTNAQCNDGNGCTTDTCVSGSCSHANACSGSTPYCSGGACVQCTASSQCDDGNACTSNVCSGGSCSYPAINCDDGNACTADSCSGGTCQHAVISCNDGNACTNDGSCSGGSCPAKTNVACNTGCGGTSICNGGGSCIAPGSVATGGSCICNQVCASGTCTGGVCAAQTGTIYGYVYSSGGGPVCSPSVSVTGGSYLQTVAGDNSGYYSVSGIPVGSYFVISSKAPWNGNWNRGVAVTGGGSTRSDITLTDPACTDSDGGQNPTVLGTTSGIKMGNCAYGGSSTDQCLGSDVFEYYCSGTRVTGTLISCSSVGSGYTCSNGICIPPPCSATQSCPCTGCYASNGNAHGSDGSGGCVTKNKQCGSGNNRLYRYSCSSGGIVLEGCVFCSNYCFKGACNGYETSCGG